MKKKENRGGARIGAGRKPKYGELTTNITFRIPISQKELIHKIVTDYLKSIAQP